MEFQVKSIEDMIYVGIVAVIAFGAYHLMANVCKFLTDKYLRKIDTEYVTMQSFIDYTKEANMKFLEFIKSSRLECQENRNHCVVVKEFTRSLENVIESNEGMKDALRILIIHTIADKDMQAEALQKLG